MCTLFKQTLMISRTAGYSRMNSEVWWILINQVHTYQSTNIYDIYRVSPSWVHWFEGLTIFECFEYLIDRDRVLFPQSHIFKSDPGIPSKAKQVSICSIWVNELISIQTVSTCSTKTRTSSDVGTLRHMITVAIICLLCELYELLSIAFILQ